MKQKLYVTREPFTSQITGKICYEYLIKVPVSLRAVKVYLRPTNESLFDNNNIWDKINIQWGNIEYVEAYPIYLNEFGREIDSKEKAHTVGAVIKLQEEIILFPRITYEVEKLRALFKHYNR